MKDLILGAILWFIGIAAVLLSITPWFGMWTALLGVVLIVVGTAWVLGTIFKAADEAIREFFGIFD